MLRGGIQISMYSTVPPWLRTEPPLIGTVTGAPGAAFPPHGSKVVSSGAVLQSPFTAWAPLWESYLRCMSLSQPLYGKNLSQNALFVNPRGGNFLNFRAKSVAITPETENVTPVAFYDTLCKQNVIFPLHLVSFSDGTLHILRFGLHKKQRIITQKVVISLLFDEKA